MTEQIKFQFREKDNEEWKDVVSRSGEFIEPSWLVGYQYRRKPEPEVVKPKWPRSTMGIRDMYKVLSPSATISIYDCDMLADAVIAHALDTGLVVLPNSTNSSVQNINYKEDAKTWRGAFIDASDSFFANGPSKSIMMTQSRLMDAILKYLDVVEKSST